MVTHSPRATEGGRTTLVAVLVCWLFVVFDGYDLIVYGNVIPSLQREWGIGPATAGTLGSLAFVGMMIGAVLAGRLSDAVGRKRAVIGCAVRRRRLAYGGYLFSTLVFRLGSRIHLLHVLA